MERSRILDKIVDFADLVDLREKFKKERKRIVFIIGGFDLINWGHARFFIEAKNQGDILVVGVADDVSRRRLLGPGHPLIHQKIRAEMLCFFRPVDFVVIVDQTDLTQPLRLLKPDVFYTVKDDWKKGLRTKKEEKIVKAYGGEVKKVKKRKPYLSSSMMINEVADCKIKQIIDLSLKKSETGIILNT